MTTIFQKKVWRAINRVPRGRVVSYSKLAQMAGYPKAIRAVATAVGQNPFPVQTPCHRIVRSDGQVGQYSGPGGVRQKKRLLKLEGILIFRDRVAQ